MKIEKDIPIPTAYKRVKESSILRTLSIGDSVFFPWDEGSESVLRIRNKLNARIRYAAPAKFIIHDWPIEKAAGFRVWRVE